MLLEHSTPEELEGFLRAPSGPGRAERNARILRHLTADCRTCRENLETATLRTRSYDYGAAFAGAEQALADVFAVGRAQETTPEEPWPRWSSCRSTNRPAVCARIGATRIPGSSGG